MSTWCGWEGIDSVELGCDKMEGLWKLLKPSTSFLSGVQMVPLGHDEERSHGKRPRQAVPARAHFDVSEVIEGGSDGFSAPILHRPVKHDEEIEFPAETHEPVELHDQTYSSRVTRAAKSREGVIVLVVVAIMVGIYTMGKLRTVEQVQSPGMQLPIQPLQQQPLPIEKKHSGSSFSHTMFGSFCIGAISAIIAEACTFPFDTLKARSQLLQARSSGDDDDADLVSLSVGNPLSLELWVLRSSDKGCFSRGSRIASESMPRRCVILLAQMCSIHEKDAIHVQTVLLWHTKGQRLCVPSIALTIDQMVSSPKLYFCSI